MPITPYHFGPSGFIGLLLRRWLDLPVFVLANVVVDIEVAAIVLFRLGYPAHRYAHTLLGGAVVGILWGVLAWSLRPLLGRLMRTVHLPYQTSLPKMILSGVLGVWLHVIIDATYHPNVRLAWPMDAPGLWTVTSRYLPRDRVEDICVLFFVAGVVLYMVLMAIQRRRNGSVQTQTDRTKQA